MLLCIVVNSFISITTLYAIQPCHWLPTSHFYTLFSLPIVCPPPICMALNALVRRREESCDWKGSESEKGIDLQYFLALRANADDFWIRKLDFFLLFYIKLLCFVHSRISTASLWSTSHSFHFSETSTVLAVLRSIISLFHSTCLAVFQAAVFKLGESAVGDIPLFCSYLCF